MLNVSSSSSSSSLSLWVIVTYLVFDLFPSVLTSFTRDRVDAGLHNMEVILPVPVFDTVELLIQVLRTTANLVAVPLLLANIGRAVQHGLTFGRDFLLYADGGVCICLDLRRAKVRLTTRATNSTGKNKQTR